MAVAAMDLKDFTGPVSAVAFSHDGRLLAAGGQDGLVTVSDVRSGKHVFVGDDSSDAVRAVMFTGAGGLLAVVRWYRAEGRRSWLDEGMCTRVDFYDIESRERARSLKLDVLCMDAALVPGDDRIAVAGPGTQASVRSVETGGRLVEMNGHREPVTCVAVSPDGSLVATGSCDRTAAVWDRSRGTRVARMGGFFRRHREAVTSVAFSIDGRTLFTGSADGTVAAWDARTGRRRAVIAREKWSVSSVAVSADGALLALGTAGAAVPWGLPDGHSVTRQESVPTVKVWGIRSRAPVRAVDVEGADVNAVAFSPAGDHLAVGTEQHGLYLVEVRGGGEQCVFGGGTVGVRGASFSPNGSTLALASGVRGVSVWDVETGRRRRVLSTQTLECDDVAFGGDARYVAVLSDAGPEATGPGSVGIWDVSTGDCVRTIEGIEGAPRCVAFSPVADRVAAGCETHHGGDRCGHVFEWDSATGERTGSIETGGGPIEVVAYSWGGQYLAVGEVLWSDEGEFRAGRISVWNVAEGRRIAVTERPDERVLSLAFVEDRDSPSVMPPPVAVALGNPFEVWMSGPTIVWDVILGEEREIVSDEDGGGGAVVVSPSGLLLATGRNWSIIYCLEDERVFDSLPGERPLAFSYHACLATAYQQHVVRVWKPGGLDDDESDYDQDDTMSV